MTLKQNIRRLFDLPEPETGIRAMKGFYSSDFRQPEQPLYSPESRHASLERNLEDLQFTLDAANYKLKRIRERVKINGEGWEKR